MTSDHLTSLEKILNQNKKKYLFKCIKDLVVNGLVEERFSDNTGMPSRQDITQFLASWFRYTGISQDQCQDWMIEYCISKLSVLSSSSFSRIRHSTKGNIRYIYRSDVDFVCLRENNPFCAHCDSSCPVYASMSPERIKERQSKKNQLPVKSAENAMDSNDVYLECSVKETYKEQFEKAMAFAEEKLNQGISRKKIVTLLTEQGFKTRTGKEWSYTNLSRELKLSQQ